MVYLSIETKTHQGALWGGRFSSGISSELSVLSKSTHFDWILAPYDLLGSKAHALALKDAGILTAEEYRAIIQVADEMLKQYFAGELLAAPDDEDVHGALERILIERVGQEIGGKLRAGRSRNDQIATLIRMYLLDQKQQLHSEVVGVIEALVEQAKTSLNTDSPVIMPGRTHLQHAQPVALAHHLLAHSWSLLRDLERFKDWTKRAKLSPYGSGALAGQTLGLDAKLVADELGFDDIEPNSIDATASRDVVAEFSFICTSLAINLSRIAEEIIIWNTKEFDFVKLHDSYSTGSSIMPQKKNPDIAELTRGKAGRIIGDLTGLLTTLKGLPLAYNRDLQEDKEPVFDQVDQLHQVLPAMKGQIATLTFNYQRLNELAPQGFALATDIAEWLVKEGVPFKVAHELAGECVKRCETIRSSSGKDAELWDLSDADFIELLGPELTNVNSSTSPIEVRNVLSALGSVQARNCANGTAISSVQVQLRNLVERLVTVGK
jgi:argininosuccinate lyase